MQRKSLDNLKPFEAELFLNAENEQIINNYLKSRPDLSTATKTCYKQAFKKVFDGQIVATEFDVPMLNARLDAIKPTVSAHTLKNYRAKLRLIFKTLKMDSLEKELTPDTIKCGSPGMQKYFLNEANQKHIEWFMKTIPNTRPRIKSSKSKEGYKNAFLKIMDGQPDIKTFTVEQLHERLREVSKTIASRTFESYKAKFRIILTDLGLTELSNSFTANYLEIGADYKTKNDVLTDEEIKMLLTAKIPLRDRALIECCLITGGRRQDIHQLNVGDITVYPDEVRVFICGDPIHPNNPKKQERTISVSDVPGNSVLIYPKNLINWLNVHEYNEDANAPLFYSTHKAYPGKRLHIDSINHLLKKYDTKFNLNGKLKTQNTRHTSATKKGMLFQSEEILKNQFGWSKKSKMAASYIKPNEDDISNVVRTLAGKQEIKKETRHECPRCGMENAIYLKRCKRCDYALSGPEAIKDHMALEKENERLREELFQQRLDNYKTLNKNIANKDWEAEQKRVVPPEEAEEFQAENLKKLLESGIGEKLVKEVLKKYGIKISELSE